METNPTCNRLEPYQGFKDLLPHPLKLKDQLLLAPFLENPQSPRKLIHHQHRISKLFTIAVQ